MEQKGYSGFTVGSFEHAALKKFPYQLQASHCTPAQGYECTIYIHDPRQGGGGSGSGSGSGSDRSDRSDRTARVALEEKLRRKYGATMNKSSYSGNNIGTAAEKGAWGRLLQLLDTDRSTIDNGATFGYSAIMTCAACPHDSEGSKEEPAIAALMMRCLIEAGCNVNHTDANSKNALHACAKFGGSVEQLSVLINAGCNQSQRNGQGQSTTDYIKIYQRFTVAQAREAGMTFE